MNLNNIQIKIDELQKEQKVLEQTSFRYSCIRFLCIFIVLITLYFANQKNTSWFYVLSIIFFACFLLFIRKHMNIKTTLAYLEVLEEAYQDILYRKNTKWKEFVETGDEFLNETTTQAYDLDLFGKASLYQYISCAKTMEGKTYLASLFSPIAPTTECLGKRQNAVKECIKNTDFTMKFIALSKLFSLYTKKKRKQKVQSLYAYMENDEALYPYWIRYLCIVLSILTIAFMIAIPLFHINYAGALICFMGSLCIAYVFLLKNGPILSPLTQIAAQMNCYEKMFIALQEGTFQDSSMLAIQERVKDAPMAIRSLNVILQFTQARTNVILNFILNGFFLLDFQCVFALQKWKQQYGKQVQDWLRAVGEVEAYVSLAQIAFAKETTCFPSLYENVEPQFSIEYMHHPLICEEQAIQNDFYAKATSYVITGSNMSGKTTFLRTIGVNMILCNAGAPVCARQWYTSLVSVYTSMRVMDDVSQGISTFYAEILRIRSMMDASKERKPMLVLIDEIFKGTNSADRIICAQQAIERLHEPWIITFVSTHDFELCDLENKKHIMAKNYHFSEYYEGDKICFDYELKEGRCTTTNARQLMKLAGFN